MVDVQDYETCPECGEEYMVEFNCHTGETSKLGMCRCDRYAVNAEEFLKMKVLFEEFKEYDKQQEAEHQAKIKTAESEEEEEESSPAVQG